MDLRYLARNAVTAQRVRKSGRMSGCVARHRIWSDTEIALLKRLFRSCPASWCSRR
jgi:hypothetical protein